MANSFAFYSLHKINLKLNFEKNSNLLVLIIDF